MIPRLTAAVTEDNCFAIDHADLRDILMYRYKVFKCEHLSHYWKMMTELNGVPHTVKMIVDVLRSGETVEEGDEDEL